jgi:hypothetical protein
MKPSGQLIAADIALILVCLALSYAGIFQYIAMPSSIQLLLQVIAVALTILSLSACGMYFLNKSIDQSGQA